MGRLRVHTAVVDPIRRWQLLHPPVLRPTVVHDHVHDDLHAFGACCVHKRFVFFIASKPAVHLVIIRGGVAVVRPSGLVVFQNGIQPNGREAHVVQVVQLLLDAGNIPTMTAVVVGAVEPLLHARDLIVRRVAIREAVRRNQVNGIRGGVALDRAFFTRLQFKRRPPHRFAFAVGGIPPLDGEGTGPGIRTDVQVDERVIRPIAVHHARDAHPRVFHHRRQLRHAVTVHHDLHRVHRHVHPPKRWIQVFNKGLSREVERSGRSEQQERNEVGQAFQHARKEKAEFAITTSAKAGRPAWFSTECMAA